MANISFDGDNRLILVDIGIKYLHVEIDVYQEYKNWLLLPNLNFEPAIIKIGGDSITSDICLQNAYILTNGWKIKPYNGNHILDIEGNLFTDTGLEYVLPIGYDIEVNIRRTDCGLTIKQNTMLKEIQQILGLDKDNQLYVSPNLRTVNGISQTITNDGNGNYTMNRL